MFDEQKLREEIVSVWGPGGAHVEIYDMLLVRMGELARESRAKEQLLQTVKCLNEKLYRIHTLVKTAPGAGQAGTLQAIETIIAQP